MADYRDLAIALGGGYGQDTGPITADTLITLKNGKTASAGDLLGMLKGFGQAVGSNLESLGRGGLSTFLGAPVDTANTVRTPYPMEVFGDVNYTPDKQLPGGSRDILGMMPRGTATRPETAGMEELGGYMTPATAKLAGKAIKATEGLPVGMGIKDIGKGITSNISQFTGFKNTTPYGKAKEVAAYLDRLNIPYTINKSKTTNSAYLEIQTGKGDFDYPMQFRFSDHSTDLPHQNRQIFTNPKPDPNFDLDVFKDGGHDAEFAVNKINELVKKVKPQPVSQRSPYPQQAALDLAQQRAALPVEQGGLGLPATNTAADRAKAMGTDVETSYIHSTSNPITKINEDGKFSGIFTLPNYSANYGTLNMPLVARGKIATNDDLRRFVKRPTKKMQMAIDERIPDNVDVADATVEMQKLRNELARKHGFSGVKVSDEFGQDTIALVNPEQIRSRFAAFDPFRKDVATATAMGVALPDLLAAEKENKQKKLSKALTK